MRQRTGKFQLLNNTQRLCILGKLTKSKKFKSKNFRSEFYHPNPSKVRREIKEIIDDFNKNFGALSKDLSLVGNLWKDKKAVDKMYNVLADFYLGRAFDWKFNDSLHENRLKLSEKIQEPNTIIFEQFTKLGNEERVQKMVEELEHDPKVKEDLEWLLRPKNKEYLEFVDKLVFEGGFLTDWELKQNGYTQTKISKMFRILTERGITTNPNERVWNYIQKRYLTPFKARRHSYNLWSPTFGQNSIWIFTPYGSRFNIILQSERIRQAILKSQESQKTL